MLKRKQQIECLIKDYKHIFDGKLVSNFSHHFRYFNNVIYVPYVPLGDINGLLLKDGVGYVTIQETFKDNTVVSYIYRFLSNEYKCSTCRGRYTENHCEYLSFHYQMDEENKPHEPHVSVIYPSLRHISRKIDLKTFFQLIEENFYYNRSDSYQKKENHIWANRAVR